MTTGSDPVLSTPAVPATTAVTVDYAYAAASSFFSGGVTSSGTALSGFSSAGARVVFTVNASEAGARPVNLSYANGASISTTLNVYVNGLYAATTTLAPTKGSSKQQETLTLRAGINTITYQVDPGNSGSTGTMSIDAVNVQGGAAQDCARDGQQRLATSAGATPSTVLFPGTRESNR